MLVRFAGSDADYVNLPAADVESLFARICGIRCIHGRLVPNVGEWRAGDIVLSATDAWINPISTYQKLIHPVGDHHRWSHVGIYDGTGFIWDANPNVHIQEHAVGNYILSKAAISIVRPRELAISPEDLVAILTELSHLSYGIGVHGDLLAFRAFGALGVRLSTEMANIITNEQVICSTFLERVLRHALGRQVFPSLPIVVPSDFSEAADFLPVPVFWQQYLRD